MSFLDLFPVVSQKYIHVFTVENSYIGKPRPSKRTGKARGLSHIKQINLTGNKNISGPASLWTLKYIYVSVCFRFAIS
jgi:hypothetical protein